MDPFGLLRWQWQGYAGHHRDRTNLIWHIFAVPLFWLGTVSLILGAIRFSWLPSFTGAVCIVISMVIQGRGHKLEAAPPAPFTSPWNFIARLLPEQWITFPRFLLSGGWRRAYRGHGG